MGKFDYKFDKILNKICEIFEQISKTRIFVNSFMKHNIKLRQKKLLTINLINLIWVSKKKNLKQLGKLQEKF